MSLSLFASLFGHRCGFECGRDGCSQQQGYLGKQEPFDMATLISAQRNHNALQRGLSELRARAMTPRHITPWPQVVSKFDSFTYTPGTWTKRQEATADAALIRCHKAFDRAGWKRPDSWKVLRERYYINLALKLYIPAMVDWINRPSTMFDRIRRKHFEGDAKRIVMRKGRHIR